MTVVDLTATPDPGSFFSRWDGSPDCADGRVTIDSSQSCNAVFDLVPTSQYTLSVTKLGGGAGTVTSSPSGINCGSDCQESYPSSTVVNLTATPNPGSVFSRWDGDSDCADGHMTMNAGKSCIAVFDLVSSSQYTLSVTKLGGGSGTVTSSPAGINCGNDCEQDYNDGTTVVLTAVPSSGSTFAGWSGEQDCSDGTVSVNQDRTCSATFDAESQGCTGLVQLDSWSTQPGTVYELGQARLGELIYTDRGYTLTDLSLALQGAVMIRSANNDKSVTTSAHLFITLCSAASVYVAYDARAVTVPDWLNGPQWEQTQELVGSTDSDSSPMQVYRLTGSPGQLILGGNQEGNPVGVGSNYYVFVTGSLFADGFENGDLSGWALVQQ